MGDSSYDGCAVLLPSVPYPDIGAVKPLTAARVLTLSCRNFCAVPWFWELGGSNDRRPMGLKFVVYL